MKNLYTIAFAWLLSLATVNAQEDCSLDFFWNAIDGNATEVIEMPEGVDVEVSINGIPVNDLASAENIMLLGFFDSFEICATLISDNCPDGITECETIDMSDFEIDEDEWTDEDWGNWDDSTWVDNGDWNEGDWDWNDEDWDNWDDSSWVDNGDWNEGDWDWNDEDWGDWTDEDWEDYISDCDSLWNDEDWGDWDWNDEDYGDWEDDWYDNGDDWNEGDWDWNDEDWGDWTDEDWNNYYDSLYGDWDNWNDEDYGDWEDDWYDNGDDWYDEDWGDWEDDWNWDDEDWGDWTDEDWNEGDWDWNDEDWGDWNDSTWVDNGDWNEGDWDDSWNDESEDGTGGLVAGVEDVAPVIEWSVYPVPATSDITFKGLPEGTFAASVYDSQGRFLMNQDVQNGQTIYVSDLPNGYYSIHIPAIAGSMNRIVVQH